MNDGRRYPELRYIDAFPFEQGGQTYYYVRDPLEIATEPLVFSPLEFFIITRFDGLHSVKDVQQLLKKELQNIVFPTAQIERLIEKLDQYYYLANERYFQYSEKIMAMYEQSPVRKAWHVGTSYEADPQKLHQQLDGFYTHKDGAGLPNGKAKTTNDDIIGILTPHIDLRVGAPAYTHAYRPLFETSDADLFIIFGIAHYGGNGFFVATEKDFETPLGPVETDRDFIREWEKHADVRLTREDWAHRIEHSIEFQLPFLQHGMKKPFKIVPVLCGSMEPYLQNGRHPASFPEIAGILNGLKQTIAAQNKKMVFILSVDLAHMGPKFGDDFSISETKAREIYNADHQMFDAVSRFDKVRFLELVKSDLLSRRVDACPAIFAFMQLVDHCRGELVNYDQNYQPDTRSMVSYGSMVFRKI